MDKYFTFVAYEERGGLYGAHVVIRIDTTDMLIFTLDRNDWNMVCGELL